MIDVSSPTTVVAHLDAEGTVVPEAVDAAVDLAGGVDEPAMGAERDELVHHVHGAASIRTSPRRVNSALARL
jgi:hypothetical protein